MYYNFKLRIGAHDGTNKLKYVKGQVDLTVLMEMIKPTVQNTRLIFTGYRPGLAVIIDAIKDLDLSTVITFETSFTDTGDYLRGSLSTQKSSCKAFTKRIVAAALFAAESTGNPRYEVYCKSNTSYSTLHRFKISYHPIVPPTLTIKLDV